MSTGYCVCAMITSSLLSFALNHSSLCNELTINSFLSNMNNMSIFLRYDRIHCRLLKQFLWPLRPYSTQSCSFTNFQFYIKFTPGFHLVQRLLSTLHKLNFDMKLFSGLIIMVKECRDISKSIVYWNMCASRISMISINHQLLFARFLCTIAHLNALHWLVFLDPHQAKN